MVRCPHTDALPRSASAFQKVRETAPAQKSPLAVKVSGPAARSCWPKAGATQRSDLRVALQPGSRALLQVSVSALSGRKLYLVDPRAHSSLQPLWSSSFFKEAPAPLSGNSRSHSYRNTTTGSTPMARRAGTAQATSAMPPSKAITPANTSGSNGRVP